MIDLTIYSPKGIEFSGQFNHIQINDRTSGSFGVLSGHVPIISTINEGDIALYSETETYIALIGAIFKLNNDTATIVSEMVAIGKSSLDAKNNLDLLIKKRIEENKKRNVELALAEHELKKQIKKSKAGSI